MLSPIFQTSWYKIGETEQGRQNTVISAKVSEGQIAKVKSQGWVGGGNTDFKILSLLSEQDESLSYLSIPGAGPGNKETPFPLGHNFVGINGSFDVHG